MWKTFFTSSMIRTGRVLVDQMRDMVSLLSIELKKQPCTCKGKEPDTKNDVGVDARPEIIRGVRVVSRPPSPDAPVDGTNEPFMDEDPEPDDYCTEECCLERGGPCTRKRKEPGTENVVGSSSMA
jgi:hypothetical protein